MNLKVQFPAEILQHIQSFLNFKDAARSATLSSSLYQTWYSCRQVDLDERLFRDKNAFWHGAKKTIRRYHDAKLCMDTFTLQLVCGYERYYECQRLLEDVSELGVKEINIRIFHENCHILIPSVVFASANLIKFSLVGGLLHMGLELPVLCPSLESLCLVPTRFTGARGDLITNYVLRCPSLKSLTSPSFLLFADYCCIESLTHNLESLTIHNFDYPDNNYFAEVITFFHQLKSLSIVQVLNGWGLRICSDSLQSVSILDRFRHVAALITAPNLKYFHFTGVSSSCFTFESTSKEMVSDIKVVCFRSNADWFIALHKLLQRLQFSKIYISVHIKGHTSNFIYSSHGIGLPVVVEKLDIVSETPLPKLVQTLDCVCLPKRFSYNHDVN